MQIAETVTFGGSGLDRDARLRGDVPGLAAALAEARVWPIWRGKPLMLGDLPGWLDPGHPILSDASLTVYLGRAAGRPCFAADISAWTPDPEADAVVAGFHDPTVQVHPALGHDQAPGHGFVELRSIMTRLSPLEAELAATAKAILQWHQSHGFCAACGARSDPAKGGWQRNCPACKTSHFPRTDPVVIMLVTHGNSVLLGRSPGWPAGMYSLLAGFVEPGETLEAAVRREVAEETGVQCGEVRYLASQPWPFPASLMLGAHTEALTQTIVLDPEELESACWLSREDLVTVFAGRHPDITPPRPGAIAEFILRNWLADRLD